MNRAQLEHVIRACGSIADDEEIVVIGSQAILGQFPEPPPALTVSMEADVYPKNHPERAEVIDGSIGEGSLFHESFGYYAQGVGPETATLPPGWQGRLIALRTPQTRGVVGWCLEVHDLGISKLAAGREKDLRYLREAIHAGLLDRAVMFERLERTPLEARAAALARERLTLLFQAP